MELFLIILFLIVGLILIVKGGDWFVDAASWIAEVSGVPQFIIGATVVSLATTLPELLVSALAASEGRVDMAVGNAIGSVNANIALIMAVSIIFMPHSFERNTYLKKGVLMVISIVTLFLLSINGSLNVWLSIILLLMFALFIVENLYSLKKSSLSNGCGIDEKSIAKEKPSSKIIAKNVALFIGGAGGIILGAKLLVDNGCALAGKLGVPESIIAVTIVAIGTSLPELVTTITAIVKKKSELSIGNIIGANILDITLILPICSMITGGSLPVAQQSIRLDMPFGIIVSLIAIVPSLIFKKFSRWQGVLLLLSYVAYMVLLMA